VQLNINLATKPYQDVRRVLLQWGVPVLLLAVCTVALVWTAISSWRESREVNARIAAVKSEIAELDKQRAAAMNVLQAPQNKSVVENSKFINGLIARKSFSWTRVFMQLEDILPPRLHVVSISPDLQPKTNTVEVHLTVAGTSREAAVELVKRLEQSPSFRDARITEENLTHEKDSADTVNFHLAAIYVPGAVRSPENKASVKVAEAKGGSR
jgi:type IV pilus assembly protein PilN